MKNNLNLCMTVYCALFTALIIIGGFISIPIPIGPVPIALADFFVMAAGLFLGFKYSLISTSLYIALGALGLPVFAGGKAGLAVLAGPTGGFLIGYLFMAASIGLIAGRSKYCAAADMTALITGNILLYLIGVPWLKFQMNIGWTAAVAAGLTPFIAGMIIKIAAAFALGQLLLPRFKQTLAAHTSASAAEN